MKSKISISTLAYNSKSESFKKINPHLFNPSKLQVEVKPTERRLRQNSSGLNKTEAQYLAILEMLHDQVFSQSITLKLGNGVRYTPDFCVWSEGRMIAYEVKGFMRDDAAVKIKVAASRFPDIKFFLVWKTDGMWHQQEVRG